MRMSYGRMLADRLDGEHGLPRGRLGELVRRFPAVQAEVRERRGAGEYGFYDLVDQSASVRQIARFAEGLGQAHDHVLVLGIGGSALGTRALLDALRAPAWNELDDEGRDFFPRLTVLENVDPTSVAAALKRIDPRRVLVNVVSKSGGTAETMAQYLVVRAWLDEALGPAAYRHLVFTTDPARGALRELATQEGIATLTVPPGVGGRFSVLSPVGLLPAALVGIDIAGLLVGARAALDQAQSDDLLRNPAALYAGLHWAADTWLGARLHVLMPYTDRLRQLAEWYRQLWAESLGKRLDRRGQPVHTGPTPVGAVGATDQHSQVQLFMEGPFDKALTFIVVDDLGVDVPIPARAGLPADLAYLPGHSLAELLRAEYAATAAALARMGRMNLTLRLPDLSAASVGELLMFFQVATGYAGVWYGIDPFDQPGVELGKRLTYAAMGRPGYEAEPAPAEAGDEI
ncbi:MAG TPA: glucose-6-phosphate isomerase [Gemmatimonadales bacterium]|jgi:glucose-6-phosphate isomerase|nr:glucose-6-phosphate isomerase [Gemmatimonadales bacterium]